MNDYRALAGNTSAIEWAKKYYALNRNYDSVTRICKEKCARNDDLEGELSVLNALNNKYDTMEAMNKEYATQNQALTKQNASLNASVLTMEKELNLTQSNLNNAQQDLKHKSKIQIDLERKIQKLRKSLSQSEDKQYEDQRTLKEYDAAMNELQINIERLEAKRMALAHNMTLLKSENQSLSTQVIQRDNIILNNDTKIKQLKSKYSERNTEYETLSLQHDQMTSKCQEIESKCTNYKMDIDIYTNRLKHYEANETNENESNVEDKMQSFRDIIAELETQNKYNLNTIEHLTAIQQNGIQVEHKYNELKQTNELIEEKLENIENKYNNLQQNYQANNERHNKLCLQLDAMETETCHLKQSVTEKENELQQLHKQYTQLDRSYNDLQRQYSSYLHKNNATEAKEIKLLSERQAVLKNDVESLLLENEEWIKKYNNLKATYDALNDDYVNCKNHSLQIESLMAQTKLFHEKNIEQMEKIKENKISELKKEIQSANDKINDIKNENIKLKNKATLTMTEYTMLCDKEDQFKNIVDKMYISDQSCEPSFKCAVCNDLFVDPITCQPCGHSYCRKCIKKQKEICKECKIKVKYFRNEILESLTNKFKMRFRTHLPALRQLASRKTNVGGVHVS
eukprot:112211_1